VLSGGAPGGFYRAGEGAHAPGDGEEWAHLLLKGGAAQWGSRRASQRR
jgi:hypothetical protein